METKTYTEKKSITTVNTKPSISKEKKKKIETKIATIVVHSGGFDKIMSAFIIGNGYLSIGFSVTMYFTFWGLNALKPQPRFLYRTLMNDFDSYISTAAILK